MATAAGDEKLQARGDDPSVDSKNPSKGRATPFSLIKLAYFACDPESREAYDTETFGVSVDLRACCKYLMKAGCRRRPFKPKEGEKELDLCSTAAFNGHIDCLRQAHVAGFPWTWRTTEVSCRTGHIECLMYVHENGCETGGSVSALAAACAGHIDTLEYAWTNGFKFPTDLCTSIARFGSIESLRYIRSLGFGWDATTTAAASRFNQLEFLEYLHQNDCPWDASTCFGASQNGNIECLRYAHTNGCEWNTRTCHAAAQNGHIECLDYAHTNGCEWNVFTTLLAIINNQHRCLNYALREGCPWPGMIWDMPD